MPQRLWRDRFAVPPGRAYLVNHSLGAMPAAVPANVARWSSLWADRGVSAWSEWLPFARETADVLGSIIGAPPGSVVMGPNVSALAAAVASCFDFKGDRNGIVYTDLEFPSLHYLWQELGRQGAGVTLIRSDGMHFPIESLLAAIDERTMLIPLSHVIFRTAEIVDVAAVIERAHSVGAMVFLDSYQAAGAVPFDVTTLGVDFCAGGSVKWLCGGPGAGWMYVRPDLSSRLEPVIAGWFGHTRPFDFAIDRIHYAEGAARFTGGTPAMPAIYAARAGYDLVSEIGPEAIRAHSMPLTARLVEGALALGLTVRSPLDATRRGGHVTVDFPEAERVSGLLIENGFTIDYRPGAGIRIGPHVFNTAEECDAVLAEIAALR